MPSFPGNARHIYILHCLFAAAFFPCSRPANAGLSVSPAFCRMFCFLLPSLRNQDFPEGSLIGTASLRRQAKPSFSGSMLMFGGVIGLDIG